MVLTCFEYALTNLTLLLCIHKHCHKHIISVLKKKSEKLTHILTKFSRSCSKAKKNTFCLRYGDLVAVYCTRMFRTMSYVPSDIEFIFHHNILPYGNA